MIIKNPENRKDGKSSFKDLICYIESGDKGESKTIMSGCRGFALPPESADEAIEEMEATASQNVRCKNPVFHAIMSWKEGEIPSQEQIHEAIDMYLKELDMPNNQLYYGLHANTDNLHLHLCINRIDLYSGKAISPANGWNKKANMRTARKIEIQQGWQRDEGGLYEVIDGQIYEKMRQDKEPAISGKARDYENITSAKSAQRIAKERYAKILFEAESWKSLHEQLASSGAQLEKKGSGGILIIDTIPVKMSSISQQLSLKKMEMKLGPYQERDKNIQILPRQNQAEEPLRNTNDSKKYLEEKKRYYGERGLAFSDLKERYTAEYSDMRARHKKERAELYYTSWKGKGAILNALSSALAWEHTQEKQELRGWHKTEKGRISQQFKGAFPSYEKWLRDQGRSVQADLWRYRESVPMVITGAQIEQEVPYKPTSFNINIEKSYFTETQPWGKLSGFIYRKGDNKIAFVDTGKRIDVMNWRDEKVMLDALRLAQTKWGRCVVHGSQQYKDLCVKVAIENNISLSNPELQAQIERESKKNAPTKGGEKMGDITLIRKEFERYHDALGADRYRVTVFWQGESGNRAWVLDKSNGSSVSTGFTADQLKDEIPLIVDQDKKNRNVYYTPISEKTHHILIDDLTKESLDQMIKDGYKPAAILESSGGNYQAIINVPKINKEFDKEIANKLMVEINVLYGDKKIQGAVHPHRVPGAHNNKAKHTRQDGTQPEVRLLSAEKRICEVSYGRSLGLLKELQNQRREQRPIRSAEHRHDTIRPLDAYMAHAKNIFQHMERQGVQNWNRVDSMIAVRMRVTGYSQIEIKEAIEIGAKSIRPEEDKNKHNWPEYAKRTAKFPESPMGQMQIKEYGNKYKNHWLKIENRQPEKQKGRGSEL